MNPEIKERALVAGRDDFGETSLRLTLLTASAGALGIIHRGARQPRKGIAPGASFDLFVTLEARLLLPRSGSMATLREATVLVPRLHLRQDVVLTAAAGTLCELVRMADLEHGHESEEVLALLESALDRLDTLAAHADVPRDERHARGLDLMGRAWLDLLAMLGHAPEWEACVLSRVPLPSPVDGGALTGRVSLAAGGRVAPQAAAMARGGVRSMAPSTELGIATWLAGRSLMAEGSELSLRALLPPLNFLAMWTEQHLDLRLRGYRSLLLYVQPRTKRHDE